MKKFYILMAAATVILGIFTAPGYSSVVTLYPTLDLTVTSNNTSSDGDVLSTGSDSEGGIVNNSFLRFDISGISDTSTITSASLSLYCVQHGVSPTPYLVVQRVVTGSDITSGMTWSTQPGVAENMGNLLSISSAWNTWTLDNASALMNDLSDNAASLRLTAASGSAGYISVNSQYGSTYAPYLTVTYDLAPVPIPGAVWLLGSGLVGLVAIRRRFNK
jgi:hypothetical protein